MFSLAHAPGRGCIPIGAHSLVCVGAIRYFLVLGGPSLVCLNYHCLSGDASNTEDTVAVIHYTLVKKGVRRAAAKDNWTATAVKVLHYLWLLI